MKNRTLVVNFYAGPGSGKSTTATGVFSKLKTLGINAEYVSEYAKELTWEERLSTLDNQVYVLGKQYHMLKRVENKVDVIVTDGPILHSLIYGRFSSQAFRDLALELHNEFYNLPIFINRKKAYNPAGRNQTLAEAKDNNIKQMLDATIGKYKVIDGTANGINSAVKMALKELKNGKESK